MAEETNKPTTSLPVAVGEKNHDELLTKMEETRKQWMDEDGEDADDTDRLLNEAIEMAVQQGRGWSPGEKESYMAKILDDDFIPPIFAENMEELEKTGLAEAFSSLQYDDSPSIIMMDLKKKGTDAFLNGKRSQVNNVQYYRDAINHYYAAFAWAQRIEPIEHQGVTPTAKKELATDDPQYKEVELDEIKSNLCANAALAHMQLKNWGFVREDSKKALNFNKNNVKAWFRLAKAHQMLQNWEEAGDAIDAGLAVPDEAENKDLLKLQQLLNAKVRKARQARQERERKRAERVASVKLVWKHCKSNVIQLGRVPLVSTVSDDDDEGGANDVDESRWHHHHPHTGQLPVFLNSNNSSDWSWPCMFVYPSHGQSDFVKHFGENEILAYRMADMFPELENEGDKTVMPWDYNNEFRCSNLAVYFEVNCGSDNNDKQQKIVNHPDSVERLEDQGATMKFYEASRALKGDEGPEMQNLVQAVERKRLHKQRKAWKKKHGSLWARPDPADVVRVHPAMTLRDALTDSRMVVANFLPTFVLIPENHPAHAAFLKEHKCIGVIQPNDAS